MNELNKERRKAVADQLASFTPQDATPSTDFTVAPQYALQPVSCSIRLMHSEGQHVDTTSPEQYS
jgi:hypothetical protein